MSEKGKLKYVFEFREEYVWEFLILIDFFVVIVWFEYF